MKQRIAITMGDAAGVGPEVIVKALGHSEIYDGCIPIVIGDKSAMEDALRFTGSSLRLNVISSPPDALGKFGTIDLIDLGLLPPGSWELKKVSALAGDAAFQYVTKAIGLALNNSVDGVVTAPINKESINLAGHHYAGHTEIFGEYTNSADFAMLLSCESLRVIHVTTHVSMRKACDMLTKERILKVIRLAVLGMKLLGFENPRIGVAGFNPHSSENGLFGDEEARGIIPAVEEAKAAGINVTGPVPPDTVFVKAVGGEFDVVVAMYHDQGHIPLKLIGFKPDPQTGTYSSMSGINCTIGLPIIRTSVDHGTAFDRAGENRANEGSMVEAIEACIIMSGNRKKL